MEIKQREIQSISPYISNAKIHPQKQVEQIAESIRHFGFLQPIVVDKAGIIIVGHGRYLAAKLLQLSVVPVLEVDISEEKVKAYRLADNKLNESEWDKELLLPELRLLSLPMLELTGFDKSILNETEINLGEPPSSSSSKEVECPECGNMFDPKEK